MIVSSWCNEGLAQSVAVLVFWFLRLNDGNLALILLNILLATWRCFLMNGRLSMYMPISRTADGNKVTVNTISQWAPLIAERPKSSLIGNMTNMAKVIIIATALPNRGLLFLIGVLKTDFELRT